MSYQFIKILGYITCHLWPNFVPLHICSDGNQLIGVKGSNQWETEVLSQTMYEELPMVIRMILEIFSELILEMFAIVADHLNFSLWDSGHRTKLSHV